MGKLIYSMLSSLDGFIEDEQGRFDWAAPDDDVHGFVNELVAGVGTYLYGRRMYETMVYWETGPEETAPLVERGFAQQWRAARKIVYSRTLTEPRSARTRIEREFDPRVVKEMVEAADHDFTVDGAELGGRALEAGIVDEVALLLNPVVVGGGKSFFPPGLHLDLELLEARSFANGVVIVRYAVRNGGAATGPVQD